jgi:hypothetical protein
MPRYNIKNYFVKQQNKTSIRNNIYEVEYLKGHEERKGKIYYEVKWKGYKKTTFEPEKNIEDKSLIDAYWNEVNKTEDVDMKEESIEDVEMKSESTIKYIIGYVLGKEEIDLTKLENKQELLEKCKELGIECKPKDTKQELIKLVKLAEKDNVKYIKKYLVVDKESEHTIEELSVEGIDGFKLSENYVKSLKIKIDNKQIDDFDEIVRYREGIPVMDETRLYTVKWRPRKTDDAELENLGSNKDKIEEIKKEDIKEIKMRRTKDIKRDKVTYKIEYYKTVFNGNFIEGIKKNWFLTDEDEKELKEGIWIPNTILEGLYSKDELKKIPYYTDVMFKKAYESLNIEEQVDYVEVVTDKKVDYNKYRKQGIKLKCSQTERIKMTIEKYLFTEIINIKNTNSGVGRVDKTNILIIPQNIRTDIYIKLYKEYTYADNTKIENLEDILDNILKEGVTGEENGMPVIYYVLASYYVVTNVVDIFNKLKLKGNSGDRRINAIYKFFESIDPIMKLYIEEPNNDIIAKIVTNLFLFIDSLHDFNKNRLSNYIGIWKEINDNNETFLDYYIENVFEGENYKETILYPLDNIKDEKRKEILKYLKELCLVIKDTNFEKHLLMSYIVYYYLIPNIKEGETINKEIVDSILFGNENVDIHKGIGDNEYFVDFVRYDNTEKKYNNDALRKYSYAALFDANPKNKTRDFKKYKVKDELRPLIVIPVCIKQNQSHEEKCIKYFINVKNTSNSCLDIKFPESFYISEAQIYCNEACSTSFINPIVKEDEIRDKLKDIKDPYKENLIERLQKIFSKNLYKDNKVKLIYKEHFDSPSVNDLFALIIWNKIENKLTLQTLDNLLSIKRIGDFGQIIDAKHHGISLLTEDSMEILLSIIKNVNCFIPYSNKNFLFFDNSIEIPKDNYSIFKDIQEDKKIMIGDRMVTVKGNFLEHKFYEKYITDEKIWSEKESIDITKKVPLISQEQKRLGDIKTYVGLDNKDKYIKRKRSDISQLQSSTTPVQFKSFYNILNPLKSYNKEEQPSSKRPKSQSIKRKYRYL